MFDKRRRPVLEEILADWTFLAVRKAGMGFDVVEEYVLEANPETGTSAVLLCALRGILFRTRIKQ